MQIYTYQPLPPGPRRIRLLQLLPCSDSSDIRCTIFNYQISIDRPFGIYEALSYCWGDRSDPQRIFIKDELDTKYQYLDVTTNLFAALHRLRDPSLPRTLWVDAICINQGDLDERGQQVQFMTTIYSAASQVVVWLGDVEADQDAIDNNQRTFQMIRNMSREPLQASDEDIKLFLNLLTRDWFTRIWVNYRNSNSKFS